jgi:hypothetical protein
MRKQCLALGLGALALGAAGLAQAATITIGTSVDGGVTKVLRATGASPGPVNFNGLVDAQWTLNSVAGVNPNPLEFDSDSINTSSGGGTEVLRVYVTESGITTTSGITSFLSGLTANNVPSGWTTTLATYINPDNAVFGTEDLLSSETFMAIGSHDDTSAFDITTSPVSLTEVYTITANAAAGTANSTIDLSTTPVPESSTWAMLLLGLGGLGFAGYRTRRRAISIV